MDWFVRRFVKASLVWFALGMSLGVFMTVRPALIVYRPAHVHMNLLGFVSMTIFGVAYHVIPRFTGHPLHSRRLAGAHWWLSNAGLALLVAGFALTVSFRNEIRLVLIAGGVLSAAGGAAFIVNLWRTIDGNAPARVVTLAKSGTPGTAAGA